MIQAGARYSGCGGASSPDALVPAPRVGAMAGRVRADGRGSLRGGGGLRGAAFLLVAATLLLACDRGGSGGTEELAQVGDGAALAAEGSASDAGDEREQGAEEGSADAEASGADGAPPPGEAGGVEVASGAPDAPSDEAAARRILALDLLMREIGYERAGVMEGSEFVIAPPGAEVSAGRDVAEGRRVSVAAFVYPNARFAAPHVADIRTREEVLEGSGEMVVHDGGRLVIHLRGESALHAQDVSVALHRVLGWSLP